MLDLGLLALAGVVVKIVSSELIARKKRQQAQDIRCRMKSLQFEPGALYVGYKVGIVFVSYSICILQRCIHRICQPVLGASGIFAKIPLKFSDKCFWKSKSSLREGKTTLQSKSNPALRGEKEM